jgi:hypothetical protein
MPTTKQSLEPVKLRSRLKINNAEKIVNSLNAYKVAALGDFQFGRKFST